jgi:hypothetical protein
MSNMNAASITGVSTDPGNRDDFAPAFGLRRSFKFSKL